MVKLSVNLNKVALLRNQRDIGVPSVIDAARTVISAGAYGVTVHPRPDERHVRYSDVYELREMLKGSPEIEFNIEGNPFTGKYMEIVGEVLPDQATLVPDEPGANTSDHGWDLEKDGERVRPIVKELKAQGIRVSMFMDPEEKGIEIAKEIGADRVELYTEPYAKAFSSGGNLEDVLGKYVRAGEVAKGLGLGVNAGHDLNLLNLGKFCSALRGVLEVSIGHALIADALEMGLGKAVKEYLQILADVDKS